jgi:hypothetical protein
VFNCHKEVIVKFRAVFSKIADVFDGFLAYVLTVVGILVSQYLPAFTQGQEIDLKASLPRLLISCVVAFLLVANQEVGRDPAGKRAKFRERMANALSHGISWNTLLHLGGMK